MLGRSTLGTSSPSVFTQVNSPVYPFYVAKVFPNKFSSKVNPSREVCKNISPRGLMRHLNTQSRLTLLPLGPIDTARRCATDVSRLVTSQPEDDSVMRSISMGKYRTRETICARYRALQSRDRTARKRSIRQVYYTHTLTCACIYMYI